MPQNGITPQDPDLDDDLDEDDDLDIMEDPEDHVGFGDDFLDDLDVVLTDE